MSMDVLGVNQLKCKRQGKKDTKGIKVVYISSPMKVKTSASEFRALVQELTGQDSDTARIMEANGSELDVHKISQNKQWRVGVDEFAVPVSEVSLSTPASCYDLPLPANSGPSSSFEPFIEHFQFDMLSCDLM